MQETGFTTTELSDPENEAIGLSFRQKLALEWIVFKTRIKRRLCLL